MEQKFSMYHTIFTCKIKKEAKRMKKNWLKIELEIKIFDCCYTCTVPIRPNLTIEQTLTKPLTFKVYSGSTFKILHPPGVWFGSSQGFLWVYSGFAMGLFGMCFCFKHWSVKQTHFLSNHLTACNFHSFYIPNTHARSAFRGLHFWLGFTLDLCIHSGLTLGLLGVNSGSRSALVNPE